jgi:hypothetical protein
MANLPGRVDNSARKFLWVKYLWKGMVEPRGIEPLTSAVRLLRSPN